MAELNAETAASAGIQKLYHYRPFRAEQLADIVSEHRIYLSSPASFNDPWDCRPYYRHDNLNNPSVLEEHVQWYMHVTRRLMLGLPEDELQRRAQYFRENPDEIADRVPEIAAAVKATIDARYRVYCLSPIPDSELMWAHYADKHRGICLEFDVQNHLFGAALKVRYLDEYPVYSLTSADLEEELSVFLSKSASWYYEQEYRLVAQERDEALPYETIFSAEGFVEIPPGSLTGVIIGCLAPTQTSGIVKDILQASPRPVEVAYARRAPDRYQLVIE